MRRITASVPQVRWSRKRSNRFGTMDGFHLLPSNSSDASSGFALVEYFPRDAKRGDASRHSTVDRDLKQRLFQLLEGASVFQGAAEMQLELLGTSQRGAHP